MYPMLERQGAIILGLCANGRYVLDAEIGRNILQNVFFQIKTVY